jgi:hypothetical protein
VLCASVDSSGNGETDTKEEELAALVRQPMTADEQQFLSSAECPPEKLATFRTLCRKAMRKYAGYAVEQIKKYPPDAGSKRDLLDVDGVITQLSSVTECVGSELEALEMWLVNTAVGIVYERWSTITAVAAMLLEKGELTGDELGQFIDPAFRAPK